MACIGFSGNMEVLLCIFWELLEEKSEERVNILASCDGVADRATTIGVTNIDWLVEENHRSVCIPRVWVAVKL